MSRGSLGAIQAPTCQRKDNNLGHLSCRGVASTPGSSEPDDGALHVRRKLLSCRGVANMADMDETFVQPLAVPKLPARFYFRFQAPIKQVWSEA